MVEGYSVTVSRWGKPIVTIEPNMLSGDDNLTDDDLRAIRSAAEHLLGFAPDPDLAVDTSWLCWPLEDWEKTNTHSMEPET